MAVYCPCIYFAFQHGVEQQQDLFVGQSQIINNKPIMATNRLLLIKFEPRILLKLLIEKSGKILEKLIDPSEINNTELKG